MKNIQINNKSNAPIYQQLYEQLSIQIYNNELQAETLLPSIRKTASELRVSVITVKKTWELLESNNLIYTVPGKGSYVSSNSLKELKSKKMKYVTSVLAESLTHLQSLDITEDEVIDLVKKAYK